MRLASKLVMHLALGITLCLPIALTGCSSGTASGGTGTAPQSPVAKPGGPYSGNVGAAINFNGSASSDPQGAKLSYAWNFGDGSTGSGVSPTHTYSAAGTYTISLVATDTSNLSSTATTTAAITAQPPVTNAGGPYSGLPGVAVSFNGSASTDPQSETLTYSWTFGDGTTGSGATPTHAYATAGTYSVSLAVTDTSSLTSTATTTAVIAYQPPVANAGGPYTGLPGVGVGFNGSASIDPQNETLSFAWNFGDGSAGSGASPTHTYSTAGNYNVSLTVTDTASLTSSVTTTAAIETTGANFGGAVYSGAQAISGAQVYLFSANNTGYGQPSISLLSESDTGTSDTVGAYVLSSSTGDFSIPAGYHCPVGSQLYLYTLGGTVGSSSNSAASLLAVLGTCENITSNTSITVNEVTTIAAAYAMAGFAVDATHVSNSGTPLAQTGIANAFANAANLVSMPTGIALANTPEGQGSAPQTTVDTLADILNACVSSSGPSSTQCASLFTNAGPGGSNDTATAAINIAHSPGANVAALYALQTTSSPFAPALSSQPNDFVIALFFPVSAGTLAIDASGSVWVGGGDWCVSKISSTGNVIANVCGDGMVIPGGIAVDMSGNAWIADGGNTVTELSSSGQPLSPSLPYGTGGWTSGPYYSPSLCVSNALAIDATGNTWVTSNGESSSCTTGGVARFTSSGTLLSGADGYLSNGLFEPTAIAIDGSGNAWLDDDDHYSMIEFSNTGSVLSGSSGYSRSLLYSQSLAIDSSGSIWVAGMANGGNTNELVKFSQSGVALGTYPGVGWWPVGVAIDGLGKAWVASYPLYAGTGLNAATGIISEYSSSGEALSGSSGYVGSGLPSRIYEGKSTNGEIYEPVAMAIDGSGDIWLANGGGVTELIGVAAPVITPIAAGLPTVPTSDGTSRLGTRP